MQPGAPFHVSAVTAFIALLNSEAMGKHDLSSLTKGVYRRAPTPPGIPEVARAPTRIHPMAGATEATSPTHMTPHGAVPPVDPKTGVVSIGVPVFNTDVRIVTDAGLDALPGEIGELVIAGPQIIPRYWRKPKETAASLRNRELRTGDVGFVDEAGWFYLVDRAKDMIIASGFKVWRGRKRCSTIPRCAGAAVVSIAPAERGVVSLKPGHDADAGAIRRSSGTMAAYEIPGVESSTSFQERRQQDHAPDAQASGCHRRDERGGRFLPSRCA